MIALGLYMYTIPEMFSSGMAVKNSINLSSLSPQPVSHRECSPVFMKASAEFQRSVARGVVRTGTAWHSLPVTLSCNRTTLQEEITEERYVNCDVMDFVSTTSRMDM